MMGMTEPQPTADMIPTRMRKRSSGDAKAKTLIRVTFEDFSSVFSDADRFFGSAVTCE